MWAHRELIEPRSLPRGFGGGRFPVSGSFTRVEYLFRWDLDGFWASRLSIENKIHDFWRSQDVLGKKSSRVTSGLGTRGGLGEFKIKLSTIVATIDRCGGARIV